MKTCPTAPVECPTKRPSGPWEAAPTLKQVRRPPADKMLRPRFVKRKGLA